MSEVREVGEAREGRPVAVEVVPHTRLDDVQALLTGTLFASLGIVLFRHAGLVTGGTVGIAFILNYWTALPFGALLFAVNLPFYLLAWRRMGRRFTLQTLAAVSLVSVEVEAAPRVLQLGWLHPAFAAVAGGLLIGTGILILFRHRASLGGLNVLVLWLQEKRGWRAGHLQLAIDFTILLLAAPRVGLVPLLLSVLGAAAMNLTLAVNHRPGRYIAF